MRDKYGNYLTTKEFMGKWKTGIQNLTPYQKIINDFRGNLIMFVGYVVGFISMIFFYDSFDVKWLGIAITIIFFGAGWVTAFKVIALRQQLKILKKIEEGVYGT